MCQFWLPVRELNAKRGQRVKLSMGSPIVFQFLPRLVIQYFAKRELCVKSLMEAPHACPPVGSPTCLPSSWKPHIHVTKSTAVRGPSATLSMAGPSVFPHRVPVNAATVHKEACVKWSMVNPNVFSQLSCARQFNAAQVLSVSL